MDLGSIVARIGADTSQLDQAVAKASKALQGMEKTIDTANAATQRMDTATAQAAQQMNQLERSATSASKAVQSAGQQYDAAFKGGQTISVSRDVLRQQLEVLQAQRAAREEMGIFEDDTHRFSSGLQLWWADLGEKMQGTFSQLKLNWKDISKGLDTAAKKLRSVGRDLNKYLTAPLVLVGGFAISAALKIDDAMDYIAESTGATGAVLAGLQDSARNMGRITASSLADVGAVTADLYRKFGLEGEMLEALGGKVLDLARLTRENTGRMTQSWTQMLRSWRLGAEQYGASLDKMLVASQQTGVGISDMLTAVVDLGPMLRGMDYGWEQAIALIGNFYKAGVDTNNLMFGLRNAVNEFAKLQLDPNATLWAYIRAIEQAATESEALAIAQQIFGQRSGPLFADAIRRGAMRIDELVGQLTEAEGAIGRTNEATWGWSEAWQQFKNRMGLAFEPLGVQLLEIGERNLPGVISGIESLMDKFNSWPLATQESVIKGFVTLAGLGPALTGVASGLTLAKLAIDAMKNPLVFTLVTIAAIVAGIGMMVGKMQSVEQQLKEQPATKFSELDRITQGQFTTAADILRSKEPDRAKQVSSMLGVSTQQLVDAKVIDKNSQLLMTDQTKLLDSLVALWQGKANRLLLDSIEPQAQGAGTAIVEGMAKGLIIGTPTLTNALELMLKEADKYLPHSNAKKGPFSKLTSSGAGFIDAWAAGVLSNSAAVDAVHHAFAQVARLMPHSDAETGPLSGITKSGGAFGITFADGIVSETGTVIKAAEILTGALMSRTESMNTRYGHNLRILRDSTDDLWWQTASIPGAAMRYAADDVLASMDNMQPKMTLELDDDLLKLLPENMQGLLTNKVEEQLDGPLTLALDADLQPKFEDKTIRGRIEAALAALGPLSAKFELTLDETGIKSYGENILSLSSLLKQVPPLFENIGTAGQGMQLTIDKNLMRLTQAASDTEQAWLHLDDVVPKVGNQFELTMGSMSTAGQGMQLSLDKSLTQLTGSNAQAATETASTWEKVKATLGTTWDNIVSKLQGAGIDMQSIMKKTGTGINQEAEKAFTAFLISNGATAEQAKAAWKQFGIDVTGETRRTFKSMEQIADEFKRGMTGIMTNLITDVSMKLITGKGDWTTILSTALNAMLRLLIEKAVEAVLISQTVQTALKWMWSPIGGLVIAGALAALVALQAAFNSQTTSDMPAMADGGIVTKPTVALIGEAGPEAVIPLSRGRRGVDAGGVVVNVTVTGNNITGDREAEALARKVAQQITDQLRRQGIKPAFSY